MGRLRRPLEEAAVADGLDEVLREEGLRVVGHEEAFGLEGGVVDVVGNSFGRLELVFCGAQVDAGVGGKAIDKKEGSDPSRRLLSLPPCRPEITESLKVDVRESPRIACHDATQASNVVGRTFFDTIACKAETCVEPREVPRTKPVLDSLSARVEAFCSLRSVEVRQSFDARE